MSPRLNSPPTEKVGAQENRHTTRRAHPRGTDGSNPVSSSGESRANLTSACCLASLVFRGTLTRVVKMTNSARDFDNQGNDVFGDGRRCHSAMWRRDFMGASDPAEAVEVLDLLLKFFGNGEHWVRGRLSDRRATAASSVHSISSEAIMGSWGERRRGRAVYGGRNFSRIGL